MSVAHNIDWAARRTDWVDLVTDLCADVKHWAEEKGWGVLSEDKNHKEGNMESYSVPDMMLVHPKGYLRVFPVARNIVGGEGRVDIEAYPALNRLMLIFEGGKWVLYTDSGIPWPNAWSKEAFYEIVEKLQA